MHNSLIDDQGKPVGVNGAFCVWLMGLSASGKTTLAQLLARALEQRGFRVEVLDGDIVRTTLSKGLGFTPEDRVTNLRRIATMANKLVRQQVVTIVAAICPYHAIREEVKAVIGEYVEVYLNCPWKSASAVIQRAFTGRPWPGKSNILPGLTILLKPRCGRISRSQPTPMTPRRAWPRFFGDSRPCGASLRKPQL